MEHVSSIRYCAYVQKLLYTITNKNDAKGSPISSGGFGSKYNEIVQIEFRGLRGINRTIVEKEELGMQIEDGSLTGCAQSIQRNESDIVVGVVQYPIDDYYRVYPYQMVDNGRVMMLSSYEVIEDIERVDILDNATHLFSPELYLAILYVIVLLGFVFDAFTFIRNVQRRRRHRPPRVIWEFFSIFIGQCSDFVDYYNWSRKMLIICLTMFSFFICNFWSNLLSTDAVVVKKAEPINNYADFLRRPFTKPYYISAFSDHRLFENAPKGSLARQIWERIDPREVDKHVYNTATLPSFMSPEMMSMKDLVLEQKLVFFINNIFGEFLMSSALRFLAQDEKILHGSYRAWRSVDPESELRSFGTAMRTELRDTIEGKQVIRDTRRAIETGIRVKLKRIIDEGMFQEQFKDPPGMYELGSRTVVTKEVTNDFQTKIWNINHLVKWFVVMMFLSFVMCVCECTYRKFKRRK